MGLYGYVEIREIDLLPITNSDCINMGKPLHAFLEAFADTYTKGKRSPLFTWFSKLEKSIIQSMQKLVNAMYVGEEQLPQGVIDEYASGWQNGDPVSKEELKEMLILEHRWTQLEQLIKATDEIIRGFPCDISETYFFKIPDTLPAFSALLQSLQRAKKMGAQQVRLRFM